MAVQIVEDPITDPRWSELLEEHPRASAFHSPGWLNALRATYGYQPFVVSTSSGSRLKNGIVACRVNGWASRRLVSLPFSDHCDLLEDESNDSSELLNLLCARARTDGCRSVELRPHTAGRTFMIAARASRLTPGAEYQLHRLDLRSEPQALFRQMHHSSTRRAIRRAEREGITCETGTSDRLLSSFYRLLRMSRRRHGLPPPPFTWFRNLVSCLGRQVAIHVASKNAVPIATMLTLSFKKTIYYKYGGSDAAHHRLGGMSFLFWRVIQDARDSGFVELDLGRSDLDQPGLTTFKDHLGATRSILRYYRYPPQPDTAASREWLSRAARGMVAHLPDTALDLAGRLVYKRLG